MTVQPEPNTKVLRFGVFELNTASGDLRKNGTRIRLQDQPARVLLHLLENRGEIVTREQLQRAVWPSDTFVDFDHGLNTAINKIRDALGDSASSPRFVETVPRKGYRFIAPVEEARAEQPVSQRQPKWILAALGLLVATMAFGAWLARGFVTTGTEPVVTPLTTLPGAEFSPSLSPDGDRVAFSWYRDGSAKAGDIYVKQMGSEQLLQITADPAPETSPAWSPDGREIAFARWLSDGQYALHVAPSMGGRERKIGDFNGRLGLGWSRVASWGPDGKWMVVAHHADPGKDTQSLYVLTLATGMKHRLTTGSALGDWGPAVSPDGNSVAFERQHGPQSGQLYLQRLTREHTALGEPVLLYSSQQVVGSPAWTRDGQIVFQSGWVHLPFLARINHRGGNPVRIAFAGEFATLPTISSRGDQLCFVRRKLDVNIWALALRGSDGTKSDYWSGSSTYLDHVPRFSPDGRRVAFVSNRNGTQALWVSDADGSRAVRLAAFTDREIPNVGWAPDGKTLYFGAEGRRYEVPSDGGTPREVALFEPSPYDEPVQPSNDGKWWYFSSGKTGRSEIWKASPQGGTAIQVTRNGGRYPQVSADGRYIYYSGVETGAGVWRIPAAGGTEQKLIESLSRPPNYQVTDEGIYYIPAAGPDGTTIRLLRFATGETEVLTKLDKPITYGFSVSPDRRTILYAQVDQYEADLELVENFR